MTGGAALAPAFTPGTSRYRSAVQSDIGAVTFDAKPARPGAQVSASVDGRPADPKTPMQLPLAVGSNQVELRVTDANGQPLGSYQITIEREDIQPVVDRFQKRVFADANSGHTMPYRLFVPEGAGSGTRFPLVVFLHGGGERGDDNESRSPPTRAARSGPSRRSRPGAPPTCWCRRRAQSGTAASA